MPTRPPVRLEADGLPSIDLAVRSPNVDDCSSEEGQTGLIRMAGEAGVDEAVSPEVAPAMHADEVAPTEMDPSAMTPPHEKRRVPGSPPPLDMEAGMAHDIRGPSPLSGHLRSMPSPLRTGRRSLSPHEARGRSSRLNTAAIPENDRDGIHGESRNFIEDSLMGTSPCTEHSMDSLASFFRDGHYYVPLRLSSVDEPLAEPAQHPRESHNDRPQDTTAQSCEHGTPCVASFPCPLASGGPGRLRPAQSNARQVPPVLPTFIPATRGVPEPPLRPMPEIEPEVAQRFPEGQELRAVRAGVPRIPAPTESVDLPSSERMEHPRLLPGPSRAPILGEGIQSTAAPPPRHVPSSAFPSGDARVASEEPGSMQAANPARQGEVPTFVRTGGVPPLSSAETSGLAPAVEGLGRRPGDGTSDLRTSGPMAVAPQPVVPNGGMLSMSSMGPPSWGFAAPYSHMPSMAVPGGPPPPGARPPATHGITQGVQAPAMYTSLPVPAFQRDVAGVGVAPPPPALPKAGVPPPARPWGTQGPMATDAVQAPWPVQAVTNVPPASMPASMPSQTASLQAPVQPARAEAHTAGRMPPATSAHAPLGLGQGQAPMETAEPANSQGPALVTGSRSSGPMPASDHEASQVGVLPPPEQANDAAPQAEQAKDTATAAEAMPVAPLGPTPEAAAHAMVDHDSKSPSASPPAARSPPFAAGVPDLTQLAGQDGFPEITTPPPPEMTEKGQQTTPVKASAHRRKRAAPEKPPSTKEGPFALVTVGMDKLKCLNQEGRPRRHQIRVLEHWRNERVLYERVRGSAMPTVCGVVVAQPCEEGDDPQSRIPIGLTAKFDDVFSPCSSKKSDVTFKSGGLDEEDAAADLVHKTKAIKMRRPGRAVQRAARAATAAAASALAAGAPERALPRRTPAGFVEVPAAAGSTHACGIRVGLENGKWMCCDIRIPPRSFNTPEELAASRSLLIYVACCEPGTLTAAVDLNVIDLFAGHSLVIRAGQEYCLRNSSAATTAQLKMVLINQ